MLYEDSKTRPLSVLELYAKARKGEFPKTYLFNDNTKNNTKVIDNYYFNRQAAPFLICNYSNKTYDYYLDVFKPYIPVFAIHFLIYAFGMSYRYKFPINDYKLLFKH